MTKRAVARKQDWGELSPPMRALPNNKWRNFVDFYILEPPGRGAQTAAARRAGFRKVENHPWQHGAHRLAADAG